MVTDVCHRQSVAAPWKEIARELAEQTDPEKICELSHESIRHLKSRWEKSGRIT